jgi:hypothetical protein
VRSTIKALNCDTCIPTEKLISICLGVIVNKALAQLRTSKMVELDETGVHWVITVPAIWVGVSLLQKKKRKKKREKLSSYQDMPARLVMQKAAQMVGILVANITIALEPEAAVLSCLDNELELVC